MAASSQRDEESSGQRLIRRGARESLPALLALLSVIAGPRVSGADEPRFPPQQSDFVGGPEKTSSVAVGDVDGDGDLDLVRGNYQEGATLYLYTGGKFVPSPTLPARGELTYGAALGDVDGDGDLDLVLGNYNQPATLYVNTGAGTFADSVRVGRVESTYGVALGDVDNDGDLDLIRGNNPGRATLYLNDGGGTFALAPIPIGQQAEFTQSVALGDVDNDGYLDLVRGNEGLDATLYLNRGGTFDPTPTWRGPTGFTRSVALGDVNGDGRLDLIRGNFGDTATLHLNIGGPTVFALTPIPVGLPEQTQSVVLGDVDSDGDLDLVRGNGTENDRQAATLYINNGGTFDSPPAWSGELERTLAIALGDVNGDGDLDLIRGNYQQSATLYLNPGVTFDATAAWTGQAERTRGLALGDVDGDGDLDLVCGNDDLLGDHPTLYLNDGGIFFPSPKWYGPAQSTSSVALGDVDRNGDLDLVRGGNPTTLYRNIGGDSIFTSTSAWSDPQLGGSSVALGDVDRDGDLDLVKGVSGIAGTARLNRNIGGARVFADTATWFGPAGNTLSVALGDMDGDGDLDLVRGNNGQSATLSLNVGGARVFADTSASIGLPEYTESVALGDVDGNGKLDLVRGNSVDATTVYLNFGGTPIFFSRGPDLPGESTFSVALGDVDGDGDLDLVRGNSTATGGSATLYLNSGGAFGSAAAWTWPGRVTEEVALGDVDGDGDLDLVQGHLNFGATLSLGKTPWVIGGVPVSQLPNNPAHLRWVQVASGDSNHYRVSFQVVDVESDPLWLVGEYQREGAPTWSPMDLDGASLRTGPFSTNSAGVAHEVVWDVERLPFDHRDVVIRLRALSPPRRAGVIQFVPSYLVKVGQVVPLRPALAASPGSLVFPTVTVGDSALATLQISNAGNQDLIIGQIDSPDPEVQVQAQPPLVVTPGQTRLVEILLAPTRQFSPVGPVRIHGNDPVQPTVDIPMVVDVRGLEVTTRLPSPQPELALGEAATVLVSPKPLVHVDRGSLFHRPRGAIAFADSLALGASGPDFVAIIPGAHVTEAGLEYYVRVENSGVSATDPPGGAASPFFSPVAAPVGITSTARADLGGEYPTGLAIPIEVSMPRGSAFQSGRVYYRPGGAAVYDSLDLSLVEVTPGVFSPADTIPGTAVGPRGVEYRVRVETLTSTLSDPPQNSSDRTRAVRSNVSNLEESASHAGGRYRMVSVPLALSLPVTATLEALLADELGPYDPTRWRSYRYLPEAGAYAELVPAGAASGVLRPEPGRAFWLIAREAHRINTDPVAGRSTPTDTSYRLPLGPGWNQVGDPYLFPVAWSVVRAESAGVAVPLEQPPVAWDEAGGTYRAEDVTVLVPFEGYWVWNPTTGPVELVIPADEAAPGATVAAGPEEPADSSAWRVEIAAVCGAARDVSNVAGVALEGREGRDPLDRSEPPVVPGPALSLYFVEDAPARGGTGARRTVDIRSMIPPGGDPATRGRRWVFDVVRSASDELPPEVSLTFGGMERVPGELEVRLVDRVLRRTIDLKQVGEYTLAGARAGYVQRASEARFELLVGTAEYLAAAQSGLADRPRVTRLLPSFPNPATAWAIIRFETARAGRVNVALYDVAGRRVRTLVDGERDFGVHELVWHGDGEDGRTLPAGVYSLRLVGPDRTDVRKLVKIR